MTSPPKVYESSQNSKFDACQLIQIQPHSKLKMNETRISKSTILRITIIVAVHMSPKILGWSCQNPCSSSSIVPLLCHPLFVTEGITLVPWWFVDLYVPLHTAQLQPVPVVIDEILKWIIFYLNKKICNCTRCVCHRYISGISDVMVHSQCSSYLQIHQFDHLEHMWLRPDIRCKVNLHKPVIWGPSWLNAEMAPDIWSQIP